MASFYVGYGHKSIGDCGTTTIFVEQVSMFVAKAIQDWPLYNGQEASTRYLDMSAQEVLNPLGTPEGKKIQDEWMKIYGHVLAELVPFLKDQFPMKEDENEKSYLKAINAKAFDIARGLLPGGITTLLSWHTNLRQAYDHIQRLNHHPLEEVRLVAQEILESLKTKYPSSFSYKQYPEQEAYLAEAEKELAYYNRPDAKKFESVSRLDVIGLAPYKKLLETRPIKTELPQQLRKFGDIRFSFPLDFGSFRDIQRHRGGVMMMPLLTIKHGLFSWYLDQLPNNLRKLIEEKITEQEDRILNLDCPATTKQYYIAMGYTVACEVTLSLPAAVYLAELRSGQTVHPTLRIIAQKMGVALEKAIPGIATHCDNSPDVWNIKRGTQDIIKKENAAV
jgi:thymidylate synthase ThyX